MLNDVRCFSSVRWRLSRVRTGSVLKHATQALFSSCLLCEPRRRTSLFSGQFTSCLYCTSMTPSLLLHCFLCMSLKWWKTPETLHLLSSSAGCGSIVGSWPSVNVSEKCEIAGWARHVRPRSESWWGCDVLLQSGRWKQQIKSRRASGLLLGHFNWFWWFPQRHLSCGGPLKNKRFVGIEAALSLN